jgi:hypothetical protein
MASTSCVTDPLSSHSSVASVPISTCVGAIRGALTAHLLQYPFRGVNWTRGADGANYLLVEIVLQCEILRHKDGLTVLLDHVKVIFGVDTPLEENASCDVQSMAFTAVATPTDVLTAYLKNSVTMFVEPLSVIADRVGAADCFVDMVEIQGWEETAPCTRDAC